MSMLLGNLHDIDEALSLVRSKDIYQNSINLFKALDYPVTPLSRKIFANVHSFIYDSAKKYLTFSKQEHEVLNRVEAITKLFTINGDFFSSHRKDHNDINFIAIQIKSIDKDRSLDAYALTKIVNKIFNTSIVILFYYENSILFSSILPSEENNDEVFLSDWYPLINISSEKLIELHCLSYENQSQRSSKEFLMDLTFCFARPYFIYPHSKEYYTYGFLENEFKNRILEDEYLQAEFKSIKDLAEENSEYYRNIYNYDYVDNSEVIDVFLEGDEDWLLLYDQTDEFHEVDTEDQGLFEDDLDDDFIEEDDEGDHDINLNEEIFDDPLRMLEWLQHNDNN